MGTYIYFDIEHAIRTHDFIIENSGGSSGIIEIGKVGVLTIFKMTYII